MASIRKLRGRWQAAVRRKGMQPRSKSFDTKSEAERWARNLEAELDRCGALPDTRLAENTTLAQILTRYRDEVSPTKRSHISEISRLNAILRRPVCYRTLTLLSTTAALDACRGYSQTPPDRRERDGVQGGTERGAARLGATGASHRP